MSVVRSPVRSVVRSPVRGVLGGGVNLLGQATSYLKGIAPYHWFDFINDRCLYASNDVGGVSGATGYSFARASQGYYTNADGTLTSFASGALRRGNRGVLIEGARTNLLLQSQTFDNASWTKTDTTVTADSVVAPNGTTTADLFTAGVAGNDTVRQDVTVSSGATVTYSRMLKRGNHDWVNFILADGANGVRGWFNLATGAVGTQSVSGTGSAGGIGIEALANGFYRCWITGSVPSSTTYRCSSSSAAANASFTRVNGGERYEWGAQLEVGSFPSSYSPTTTASATRAADVLSCTAIAAYPESLWSEFERTGDTDFTEVIMQLDDGTANERVAIGISGSDTFTGLQVAGGATVAGPTVAGTIALNTVYKGAGRFELNNCNVARSGTLGTNDTSCALPATPSMLRFGRTAAGANGFFGYIHRAAVFNSGVVDANLQAITT